MLKALILFFLCISPLLAFGEVLHIKLPKQPLTQAIVERGLGEQRTTYYQIGYRFQLERSLMGHVIRLTANFTRQQIYTEYADGRKEYSARSQLAEANLTTLLESEFAETRQIPYEIGSPPQLTINNSSQGQSATLETETALADPHINSYHIDWFIIFPYVISETQVNQATIDFDQAHGVGSLVLPEESHEPNILVQSEYNIIKTHPYCWNYRHSCLLNALLDIRELNVIPRWEQLSGQQATTPLQKKVFKESAEFQTLKSEMIAIRSTISSNKFCMELKSSAYDLKHKGLSISDTINAADVFSKEVIKRIEAPLGVRFSNLKPLKVGTQEKGSPSRTFIEMSEKAGLALEQKALVGCFYVPNEISLKEGTYTQTIRIKSFGQILKSTHLRKYRFIEAHITHLILNSSTYVIDKRGRLKDLDAESVQR